MPAVLSVALAALAAGPTTGATATAAPPSPATSQTPAARAPSGDSCPAPSADSRAIIICTQRPQGYRLNPDIMEARREAHRPGRPVRPGGKGIPDCEHVGPFPCVSAGIPLIGAALTAAEMAQRLAKGQEIGSMFVTDPQPSEYQLYQMAKARREAEEAEKAATAKAKATAAAAKSKLEADQGSTAEPSRE